MSANHLSSSLSISPSASSSPDKSNESKVPRSFQQRTPTSKETRFFPNKTERSWLAPVLAANGAAVAKGKTMEQIGSRVAAKAGSRHVTNQMVMDEQSMYGMSWSRSYMEGAKTHQLVYIAQVAMRQSKAIAASDCSSDGEQEGFVPVAAMRDGRKKGEAQHNLDQALLEHKIEADKRVVCSEDHAGKAIKHRKEARKEKADRLQKRKAAYEKTKKEIASEKKRQKGESSGADRQSLEAQIMTANAVTARVAISGRTCEQLQAFISLYATKNGLPVPTPTTMMPSPLPASRLEMDPALLSARTSVVEIGGNTSTGNNESTPSSVVRSDGSSVMRNDAENATADEAA